MGRDVPIGDSIAECCERHRYSRGNRRHLWSKDELPSSLSAGFEVERKEQQRLDLREILRAWALGDADKMNALMLGAFLREFGKAPDLSTGPGGVSVEERARLEQLLAKVIDR